MCMQHAPGAFDFDDEGLSVFRPDGEWTDEEVEEAAGSCPTSAIRLGRGGPDAPAG
jgi:ferredoxin